MEKYQEFLSRIGEFQLPDMDLGKSYFRGRASLKNKIDEDNRLRDFYGDTVVFELDEETKEAVGKIIDEIYATSQNCFAERLDTKTLHMTLHDLSNSQRFSDVEDAMKENLAKIKERLHQFPRCKIEMKSKCIFNMVNTSLVIGLVPIDEGEYDKLMRLWAAVDEVKRSPYPLTPHITLGYYNVHGFDEADAKKLEEIVGKLNRKEPMDITLDTRRLYYQRFTSMNRYESLLNLEK